MLGIWKHLYAFTLSSMRKCNLQWEQVVSKARRYLNRSGETIGNEAFIQKMTSWDLMYHLGRANFDGLQSGHTAAIWEKTTNGFKGELLRDGWSRAKYEYGRSVEGLRLMEVANKTKIEVRWKDTREGSETKGKESTALVDFVVCADGASSGMRKRLLGQEAAERKYVGYVAFRGTVPETELETSILETFLEHFSLFHADGTQILAYVIPGLNGAVRPGERLVNWVWYRNFPEESEEFKAVMTDLYGKRHRYTLPTGGTIQPDVWESQTQRAVEVLPPQFAELVKKTKKPFVQAITDAEPPKKGTKVGRLLNGKVALSGDALAGFRPHTAASTSQAAFDALKLEEAVTGKSSWEDYEESVIEYATNWQRRGVMLGLASQF
jgi:2-polyprenyl-6-methoxyphenol hydroxylase-like FAD-dependent oxidoreductase